MRNRVFQHIRENAKEKDIRLDCVNGYQEHRDQEAHHRTKTFSEEMDTFMKKYGWKLMDGEIGMSYCDNEAEAPE